MNRLAWRDVASRFDQRANEGRLDDIQAVQQH